MNTRDKAALKTLFCLLCTLPLFTIETVQTPWYYNYFHQRNGAHYKRNISLIDFAQKIRGVALLLYYRATHKKAHLDKALAVIENRLKEFEEWLLALEQEALIDIKQKYAISDEIWHKCLADIELVKHSYKNGTLIANKNAIHDDTISADLLKIITTLLQQNNIDPRSISIKMVSDEKKIATHANTIAQAITFIESTKNDSGGGFTIHPEYIPYRIELFPRVNNESPEQQMSFCAHEIQHIVSQHSTTDIILTKYLEHYYSIDNATFKKSSEYHQLSQIHEAQAEILAAIKNPTIANCMRAMRKQSYYPDHLYEEHFLHVATIDMLWKIYAKLEALRQKTL